MYHMLRVFRLQAQSSRSRIVSEKYVMPLGPPKFFGGLEPLPPPDSRFPFLFGTNMVTRGSWLPLWQKAHHQLQKTRYMGKAPAIVYQHNLFGHTP